MSLTRLCLHPILLVLEMYGNCRYMCRRLPAETSIPNVGLSVDLILKLLLGTAVFQYRNHTRGMGVGGGTYARTHIARTHAYTQKQHCYCKGIPGGVERLKIAASSRSLVNRGYCATCPRPIVSTNRGSEWSRT